MVLMPHKIYMMWKTHFFSNVNVTSEYVTAVDDMNVNVVIESMNENVNITQTSAFNCHDGEITADNHEDLFKTYDHVELKQIVPFSTKKS